MDIYENLVETYLTVVEGCAVIPQVPILRNRQGESWSAYPDFLALNFKARKSQIVEVNKSTSWQTIRELIERRLAQREDIEDFITNHTLNQQLGFPLQWRFFIRVAHRSKAEDLARARSFNAEISDLESVFRDLAQRMP